MVLDAFTYVAYASRRLHGTGGASVRLRFDPGEAWSRQATTTIPIGTPTAWVLVRVMVDGPEDLETARSLQRGVTVTAPPGHPSGPTTPTGAPNRAHEAGAGFFDELAAAIAVDPPASWHPAPPAAAADLLGDPSPLATEERAAAVALGEERLAAYDFGNDARANGWGTRRRGSDFGDDVLARAAGAKFALAGHHPAENRSYVALTDDDGQPLDGSRGLVLRFPPGGTPPCDGFWSLTVYGTDMFLVENELDRWSIGDRTPGLQRDDDGGLTITIGGSRPTPTSNWLPAPAGRYRLGLRVYEGRPEVVDATWFPPPLIHEEAAR
jgi:hypothetical protein